MSLPAESTRPAAPAGRSLIAQDVRIHGDITSDGTVEIMGEVEGKITARTLVLGPDGRVKGAIMAETIDIRGKLEGQAVCVTLALRSTALVRADLTYSMLSIESGATIEGRFTRSKG
ncbi:bactofilin family protein [Gemmobacter denitrificans]|uniref:Polymer-forming cytoskeletal protein n=1 Tax=Gemmobacter denitrificans TaxID=3123040 RepID=A0ABU8C1F3_9RHOB